MLKYLLVFVSLISHSLLTFRPMSKRTIDFGGNVCLQIEYDGNTNFISYVKPCPTGKYCHSTESSGNYLSTCETYTEIIKTLGETCESDIECDIGLYCDSVDGTKKCTLTSTNTYLKTDSVSGDKIYYCLSDKTAFYTSGSTPSCDTLPSGVSSSKYSSTKDSTTYTIPPGPYQVAGTITFKDRTTGDYESSSVDISDIGIVDTGRFVEDERACKSGFALPFYVSGSSGTLTRPDGVSSTNTFKLCVDVKEVEEDSNNCRIKYSLSDGVEKIYYLSKMNSYFTSTISSFCNNLLTKLEMFKNYIEKLEPIKAECKSKNYYEEPFTCRNDELRKWWYFYYHPNEYMLYKDQTEVEDYLLQAKYKTYTANKGGFLFMNYLLCLLILLFL